MSDGATSRKRPPGLPEKLFKRLNYTACRKLIAIDFPSLSVTIGSQKWHKRASTEHRLRASFLLNGFLYRKGRKEGRNGRFIINKTSVVKRKSEPSSEALPNSSTGNTNRPRTTVESLPTVGKMTVVSTCSPKFLHSLERANECSDN